MRNDLTRWFSSMIAGSILSACASLPEFAAPGASKTLVLEEALAGQTLGEGVFVNSLTGAETNFSVVINGTWDGKILTLIEDFTFEDGTKDRKTWNIVKTDAGRYRGTREDVLGSADVTQDGQTVRLDYYVTLRTGLGGINVRFRDLLYLQDDRTIANKAVVSKFGLRIGRVEITMRTGQHNARMQVHDHTEQPIAAGNKKSIAVAGW
jgi:Protein of unknown function (DUF3833)